MDKNTITGFVLIAAVLFGFSWFSRPSEEEIRAQHQQDSIAAVNKAKQEQPDAKAMIFLLSDGEQNVGFSLTDIDSVVKNYQIPIYSIGYNANIEALKRISETNEAATINADSDDIVYQLKNLFNSEM